MYKLNAWTRDHVNKFRDTSTPDTYLPDWNVWQAFTLGPMLDICLA